MSGELEARVDISDTGDVQITTVAGTNTPARYPLTIMTGGDWTLRATWFSQPSTPEDLSAASATFTIYDAPNGTAVVSLSGGSGITLAASAPTLTISIAAATVAAYTWGPRAVYRLAVTTGGTTTVLLTGAVVRRGA